MTRYRVAISNDLLARRPWNPVTGWRLVRVIGRAEPFDQDVSICEAEDDDAPPELEGELVTPIFRHHGDGTVTVISREVDTPHPS